jgi:molecular chaperone HtpG
MLLNEDCFASLVTQPRKLLRCSGDKPWHALWKEFLVEQQKYGFNALRGMFQDDNFELMLPPDTWTAQQRRIIGEEFLRKHHSRLAHEIAIWGLPQVSGRPLKLILGIRYEMRDIAGFIARSHYLELRDCLGYLRRKYDVREYQNTHAVFLMAVLRVADYLQLQAERAPGEFLRIHKLRNPKSQEEWIAHKSIRDIRQSHEDPKAVFIHAKPKDVKTFLKLKGWLEGIQYELDSSWEILDELNGRYPGLQNLTLTVRRVRSNLDDIPLFGRTVPYVPADIQFRAAGGELLKKLVKPLYGDHPEIGVRELLQNAVDAVHELHVYKPQYSRTPVVVGEHITSTADVVLVLEETESGAFFTVEDRGIGMTDRIIREYFLTAGKSLRESREWKSLFLQDGSPVLPRSGRFGVGALAAFLMGDEIQVSSRHIESKVGYEFVARLNEESI